MAPPSARTSSESSCGAHQSNLAIVDDKQDDRRQPPVRGELSLLDEPLIEEDEVGRLPQGHEALDLRLEFNEDVDVERLAPEADAPCNVALAIVEPLGDMGGVVLLQGGEVEVVHPGFVKEATEEVFDHPGVSKQETVAAVMPVLGCM